MTTRRMNLEKIAENPTVNPLVEKLAFSTPRFSPKRKRETITETQTARLMIINIV
ncbi:hypothetical protein KEJ18_00435 [Candidatus Bathyarchaeota archaeon]|nr:hypothetical protein [Candidatus Bathyarchaeota archaeon]